MTAAGWTTPSSTSSSGGLLLRRQRAPQVLERRGARWLASSRGSGLLAAARWASESRPVGTGAPHWPQTFSPASKFLGSRQADNEPSYRAFAERGSHHDRAVCRHAVDGNRRVALETAVQA